MAWWLGRWLGGWSIALSKTTRSSGEFAVIYANCVHAVAVQVTLRKTATKCFFSGSPNLFQSHTVNFPLILLLGLI